MTTETAAEIIRARAMINLLHWAGDTPEIRMLLRSLHNDVAILTQRLKENPRNVTVEEKSATVERFSTAIARLGYETERWNNANPNEPFCLNDHGDATVEYQMALAALEEIAPEWVFSGVNVR